ncbi:MAG: NYN domain-containing protein [Kiritimatiellae bacterium]|nr:NYN domain-containing protein [Kiritimatiellia bacterium]
MITGTPTMIYVDGFNLYYGALKGTPYKWLNFEALFARVFPNNRIVGIRYFTAPINALPSDPDQPLRQQRLFRALRTLPLLTIIEGHYLCHPKSMPLVNPPPGGNRFAQVLFTEEKGSDVNLASYLLMDGFKNAYDCAIVVSGDSDLATPITMARQELAKTVGVLLPQRLSNPPQRTRRRSARLQQVASFFRDGIRTGVLAASQFPSTLTDAHGTFTKPASW